MKIITRLQAIKLGKSKYYTGKQCPQKHKSERYVGGGGCVMCACNQAKKSRLIRIAAQENI